jgi:hypothetical protein
MVIALVERGGNVRAFHPARADGTSVNAIVRRNIARESRLHTDESRLYIGAGQEFAAHEKVTHSHGEYVRDDVHTPIRLKGSFRSSSAECAAFISIVRKNICTDTLRNTTSVTTTAPLSATMTLIGRLLRFAAVKASASPIINLTRLDFKFQAARFLRWRRKRR